MSKKKKKSNKSKNNNVSKKSTPKKTELKQSDKIVNKSKFSRNDKKTIIGVALIVIALVAVGIFVWKDSKSPSEYAGLDYSKYVKVGNYKGLEYTYDVAEISDQNVEEEIEIQLSSASKAEDRDVVKKNYSVTVDYKATQVGKEISDWTDNDVVIDLGSGYFEYQMGDPLEGFEDALIGAKVGDTVSVDIVAGDEQEVVIPGSTVHFDITVKGIQEDIVPTIEEYVKDDEDFDTVEEYKAAVRDYLEKQAKEEANSDVYDQLWSQVMASSELIDYPEDIFQHELEVLKQHDEDYAAMMGMTMDDLLASSDMTQEEYEAESRELAKEEVMNKLVGFYIADKEGVDISNRAYKKFKKEYLADEGMTESQFKEQEGTSFDEYCEKNDLYGTFLLNSVVDKIKELGKEVDSTENKDSSAKDKETTEGTKE